jgi:hypothetical protein
MRRSILAAASVIALGIGGVGAYAATNLAPSPLTGQPSSSAATGETQWYAGYGIPATPQQTARIGREVAHYRQLAAQSQQRHARSGESHEKLGGGAPV